MQAPIDLPLLPKDKEMLVDSRKDRFSYIYSNLLLQNVKWNGWTSIVENNQIGTMHSYFAWERGTAHLWQSSEFLWHGPSEHTIEGKRFALELQLYHKPAYNRAQVDRNLNKDRFGYSVLSVLFDSGKEAEILTDEYEKKATVDLFESMYWGNNKQNTISPEVKIGNFLMNINAEDRWTYEGSLTFPPCWGSVNYNVVRKVYYVPQKYVDQWKMQLAR